jgi:hypothetical protein
VELNAPLLERYPDASLELALERARGEPIAAHIDGGTGPRREIKVTASPSSATSVYSVVIKSAGRIVGTSRIYLRRANAAP